MHDFDAGKNDARTSEFFEALDRSSFSLDGSMILLDNVIEILALPDHDLRAVLPIVILDPGFVGAALVDVGDPGKPVILDGAREESTCGTTIAFGGEQEINGVSLFIHRAVPIAILAANLDVRLVHAPALADRAPTALALSFPESFL